jgi:hypothetical protein
MTQGTISIVLGIWGAILSTALAGIKILEVWRERLRLSTSWSFSNPDYCKRNEIVIENPSKTPVMISNWELLWRRRRVFKCEITGGRFLQEGYYNITIAAHGRHTLEFTGQEYFDWGRATVKMGKLYLNLYVVGRRSPVLLKVYDPNK